MIDSTIPAADEYVPLAVAAFELQRPYQTVYSQALSGRLGKVRRRDGKWYVAVSAIRSLVNAPA
jgi:hypothetical protein